MKASQHQPVISVKEARKILGKAYLCYSDEQITQLIEQLDSIVVAHISAVPK